MISELTTRTTYTYKLFRTAFGPIHETFKYPKVHPALVMKDSASGSRSRLPLDLHRSKD